MAKQQMYMLHGQGLRGSHHFTIISIHCEIQITHLSMASKLAKQGHNQHVSLQLVSHCYQENVL